MSKIIKIFIVVGMLFISLRGVNAQNNNTLTPDQALQECVERAAINGMGQELANSTCVRLIKEDIPGDSYSPRQCMFDCIVRGSYYDTCWLICQDH